jgi:hypothetical protein
MDRDSERVGGAGRYMPSGDRNVRTPADETHCSGALAARVHLFFGFGIIGERMIGEFASHLFMASFVFGPGY